MTEKMRKDLTSESVQRFVDEMCALGLKKTEILNELESYFKGVDVNESDS
jgi:DNA-binding transcriptional regulator YhcF (GntR family)